MEEIKTQSKRLDASLLMLAISVVSGCGGAGIYHKADHELALQARDAFDESNVSAGLESEYEKLDEVLDAELALQEKFTRAERNQYLVNLLREPDRPSDPWSVLEGYVVSRIDALSGEGYLESWNEVLVADEQLAATIATHNKSFQPLASPDEATDRLQSTDATDAELKSLAAIEKQRLELSEAEENLRDAEGHGEIGRTRRDLARVKASIEQEKKAIATMEATWKAAHDKYQKQLSEAKESSKQKERRLASASDCLSFMASLLSKKDGFIEAVEPGAKCIGQDAPDGVLQQLETWDAKLNENDAGLKQDLERWLAPVRLSHWSEEAQRVWTLIARNKEFDSAVVKGADLVALRVVEAVTEEIKANTEEPGKEGSESEDSIENYDLLLVSRHLRSDVDYLVIASRLSQKNSVFLASQVQYLELELNRLKRAKSKIDEWKDTGGGGRTTLYDTVVVGKTAKRSVDRKRGELAASALADFAESWNAREEFEKLKMLRVALSHKEAVDYSAIALTQWANLIGLPLDQLVKYHAAGISPAELSSLLVNAAGFGIVSAGVFR